MRKKDDTLRDTLLDCARCVADAEGIEAVNIRSIARKAGIATGTVYNYFANKDEILLALTEAYWKQALVELGDAITSDSFCGHICLFEGPDRPLRRSAHGQPGQCGGGGPGPYGIHAGGSGTIADPADGAGRAGSKGHLERNLHPGTVRPLSDDESYHAPEDSSAEY